MPMDYLIIQIERTRLWTLQDLVLRVDGCIQAARRDPCKQHINAAAVACERLQRYLDEIGASVSKAEVKRKESSAA